MFALFNNDCCCPYAFASKAISFGMGFSALAIHFGAAMYSCDVQMCIISMDGHWTLHHWITHSPIHAHALVCIVTQRWLQFPRDRQTPPSFFAHFIFIHSLCGWAGGCECMCVSVYDSLSICITIQFPPFPPFPPVYTHTNSFFIFFNRIVVHCVCISRCCCCCCCCSYDLVFVFIQCISMLLVQFTTR